MLESRLALFDERAHPFLLILGRKRRVKFAALEQQPFGERRFVRAINASLIERPAAKTTIFTAAPAASSRSRMTRATSPARSLAASTCGRSQFTHRFRFPMACGSRCVPPTLATLIAIPAPELGIIGGDDDVAG
jgi:hypothetical protein